MKAKKVFEFQRTDDIKDILKVGKTHQETPFSNDKLEYVRSIGKYDLYYDTHQSQHVTTDYKRWGIMFKEIWPDNGEEHIGYIEHDHPKSIQVKVNGIQVRSAYGAAPIWLSSFISLYHEAVEGVEAIEIIEAMTNYFSVTK